MRRYEAEQLFVEIDGFGFACARGKHQLAALWQRVVVRE